MGFQALPLWMIQLPTYTQGIPTLGVAGSGLKDVCGSSGQPGWRVTVILAEVLPASPQARAFAHWSRLRKHLLVPPKPGERGELQSDSYADLIAMS